MQLIDKQPKVKIHFVTSWIKQWTTKFSVKVKSFYLTSKRSGWVCDCNEHLRPLISLWHPTRTEKSMWRENRVILGEKRRMMGEHSDMGNWYGSLYLEGLETVRANLGSGGWI